MPGTQDIRAVIQRYAVSTLSTLYPCLAQNKHSVNFDWRTWFMCVYQFFFFFSFVCQYLIKPPNNHVCIVSLVYFFSFWKATWPFLFWQFLQAPLIDITCLKESLAFGCLAFSTGWMLWDFLSDIFLRIAGLSNGSVLWLGIWGMWSGEAQMLKSVIYVRSQTIVAGLESWHLNSLTGVLKSDSSADGTPVT